MSTFTYLVTIEVERETGKFVSRDELSELIVSELEESPENANMSGMGTDGNSEYYVANVEVKEMERKDLRQVHIEYDERVSQETPSERELRNQIKQANVERNKADARVASLQKDIVRLKKAERETNPESRIYYDSDRTSDVLNKRTYLPDGSYNLLNFRYAQDWDEVFQITMNEDNELEIRNNSFAYEMCIQPTSGNTFKLFTIDRRKK